MYSLVSVITTALLLFQALSGQQVWRNVRTFRLTTNLLAATHFFVSLGAC